MGTVNFIFAAFFMSLPYGGDILFKHKCLSLCPFVTNRVGSITLKRFKMFSRNLVQI